ncbi:MAG TPA: iron uptake transporter permease EfeU [Microbacteriaceae bacterium]|nr:iron uptake transporter permease EfeU [Microbacteriaceae bacterium]
MLANYLIGLREGLEAGLIVGILVAYAVKSNRRDILPKLWIGVGIAVAVMIGLGAFLTLGPIGITDEGQEAIAGILSVVAVAMVTWMIFWMGKHATELAGMLRGKLEAAMAGSGMAIVVVAMVGVMREGIETALFVWAAAQTSGNVSIVGALLGIATAVVLSWLIYLGLIRINLRTFFAWTGILLVVFAAGVLRYATHEFQEIGWLPEGLTLYTLGGPLATTEPLGALLAGLVNFTPKPTLIEAIVWGGYLVIVGALFLRQVYGKKATSAPALKDDDAPKNSAGTTSDTVTPVA